VDLWFELFFMVESWVQLRLQLLQQLSWNLSTPIREIVSDIKLEPSKILRISMDMEIRLKIRKAGNSLMIANSQGLETKSW
jgi:hypothetical protein